MTHLRSAAIKLERARQAPAIPYFAVHPRQSGEPLGDAAAPRAFDGLHFCHLLQTGNKWQVVSYWVTREHFERAGETFQIAAHASAPVMEGYVLQLLPSPSPWWKQIRPITWLLALTTLLGAFEALRNHYDFLLDEPALFLEMGQRERIQLVEGARFEQAVTAFNRTPVAHRSVHVVAAHLEPQVSGKVAAAIAASPSEARVIAAGDSQEFRLTSDAAPGEGAYTLVMKVSAKAGLFRRPAPFEVRHPVEIWPRRPRAELKANEMSEGLGLLSGTLILGLAMPGGFECEMIVRRQPGLRLVAFDFEGERERRWVTNDLSPGQERALLRWSSLPMGPFKRVDFQVVFADPRAKDWAQIVERTSVNCQPLKQEAPAS